MHSSIRRGGFRITGTGFGGLGSGFEALGSVWSSGFEHQAPP